MRPSHFRPTCLGPLFFRPVLARLQNPDPSTVHRDFSSSSLWQVPAIIPASTMRQPSRPKMQPSHFRPFTAGSWAQLILRRDLPPAPKYLETNYPWVTWQSVIAPAGHTIPVTTRDIPQGPNPVAYGRFRYTDVWETEEHIFSFILPVGVGDDHSVVATVSKEYTRST